MARPPKKSIDRRMRFIWCLVGAAAMALLLIASRRGSSPPTEADAAAGGARRMHGASPPAGKRAVRLPMCTAGSPDRRLVCTNDRCSELPPPHLM